MSGKPSCEDSHFRVQLDKTEQPGRSVDEDRREKEAGMLCTVLFPEIRGNLENRYQRGVEKVQGGFTNPNPRS